MVFNLLDAGLSIAEVARRTRKSVTTVYKYKKLCRSNFKQFSEERSLSRKLLPFQEKIKICLQNDRINNFSKLYRELKNSGYTGSYSLLNSYFKKNKYQVDRYKRSLHIETDPGEQAQVDWGSFGEIKIGNRIARLYAFVYVLSYSRAMHVEFVVRQNQQTFQNCHINAFEKLGIPKRIRYDNVKTVVLGREKLPDGSKKIHFNPTFIDFASYYGFQPELCPPYWPRAKGKVEAGIKYLRHNFMAWETFGSTFNTLDELNRKVASWLDFVAQQRVHKSTNEKPLDRWLNEKKFLQFPINIPPYNTSPFLKRMSTKDGLIQYKSNLYSVPSKFSRKKLFVKEISRSGIAFIEIYYHDVFIATHQVSLERGQWVVEDNHLSEPNPPIDPNDPVPFGRNKHRKRKDISITIATRDLSYYNSLIPKHN